MGLLHWEAFVKRRFDLVQQAHELIGIMNAGSDG
jgi:hypothetical protein